MPTRSNEQLCRLAQKGDTAARDILLEKNLGFIRKIALEQYRNMGLDENDIGMDLDVIDQELSELYLMIENIQFDDEVESLYKNQLSDMLTQAKKEDK